MNELLSISKAANVLGVTVQTLRNWDKSNLLKPDDYTKGGNRRYRLSSLVRFNKKTKDQKTIAYARVSSYDQREDINRQIQALELYCSKKGYQYEIIQDIGSGINYKKKGLTNLINQILENKVSRLVITHKDRLLRFGSELIFNICQAKGVEVEIINQGQESSSFEVELTKDIIEIITVFSASLYGSRSNKNKKFIQTVKEALND